MPANEKKVLIWMYHKGEGEERGSGAMLKETTTTLLGATVYDASAPAAVASP
jgi:hypothetical protein